MRLLRHGQIFRSDSSSRPNRCEGLRPWLWFRELGLGRPRPQPLVSMSLPLAIARRVARRQSPRPLHQLRLLCNGRICWTISLQRTVNSVLTFCLTSGGHRKRQLFLRLREPFPELAPEQAQARHPHSRQGERIEPTTPSRLRRILEIGKRWSAVRHMSHAARTKHSKDVASRSVSCKTHKFQ